MLLSVLGGCIREEVPVEKDVINLEDPEYPSEGKAVINMSFRLPGGLKTKAMADQPNIQSIRVLIFGSSGYLKESLDAESLQHAQVNGDGSTVYSFTVHPSLSDSKNLRVHVIANFDKIIPWDYEETVMNHEAFTTGGDEAYWVRFILPQGITLSKTFSAETQRMEYDYITEGNKKYFLVTPDITAKFSNLPLIRNFAKITVESTTPQLILDHDETMAIINTPDRGSVAPYNKDSLSFISYYDTLSYAHLKAMYNGFSPQGMQFTNTSPDNVPFVTCYKDDQTGDIRGGAYMYERPKPTGGQDAPSYLIIHGTYYPLKDGKTKTDLANHLVNPTAYPENPVDTTNPIEGYYKIDFSDEDGYYAIFRNFRYHIRITSVSKEGASTPATAGATGGTGDISSSASAAALTDISDGYGRIAVSMTEVTYVENKADLEFKYKFIPDIDAGDEIINNYLTTETVSGQPGPVTITINAPNPGNRIIRTTLDEAITNNVTGTDVTSANGTIRVESTTQDAEGYRAFHLSLENPTSTRSEQTITITGRIDEFKTISREIKLILIERQNMTVTCEADEPSTYYPSNYVEQKAGQGINVKIKIPIGLPESMFPLVFDLESDNLSLTPNTAKYPDDNMPVESGKSICDGQTGKSSFHYKKTISYDDYTALTQNNDNTKTIICHFKTNKAESAGKVYVTNEFFNKANAEFKNFTMYSFTGVRFSSYTAGTSANFYCYFYLDGDDPKGANNNIRKITVTLVGCNPQSVSGNSGWAQVDPDAGIYTYDVKTKNEASLALKALASYPNNDTFYKVTITAYDTVDGNNVQVYHETAIASRPQNFYITPDEVDMHVGQSQLLTAVLVPEHTQYSDVTWESSNTSVATVTNGRVYAVGMGQATITARVTNTTLSATCAVTVSPVDVTGVVLDKNSIRIGVNKTYTLNATVTPTNATNKNVTWSSSDPSIATVNANGVVTGVALGTTVITVTSVADNTKTATCTVNVVPTPVEGVSLNKTSTTLLILNPNNMPTEQLTATITPANAENKNVTWTSSNTAVATVSSTGLVTAVAPGTATITVLTEDGGYTASCQVRVIKTYYSVNLNASNTYGWTDSSITPDSNSYYSYQSDNYHQANSLATMSVTVVGYTEFTVYIRSNAESTYDYMVVRNLDAAAFTSYNNVSTSGVKDHTSGRQNTNNGTSLSHYRTVTFTTSDGLTADDTPHTFYIQYKKDSSVDTNEDRGYVLIPKSYTREQDL